MRQNELRLYNMLQLGPRGSVKIIGHAIMFLRESCLNFFKIIGASIDCKKRT